MHDFMSTNSKALFFPDDLQEVHQVRQDKCLTIQHFGYKCNRERTERGIPYGPTQSSVLQVVLRTTPNTKFYYNQLQNNLPHKYSFLFNTTFDENKVIKDYDAAMVIVGYVVDIEEVFDASQRVFYSQKGNTMNLNDNEQMLISISILLNDIIYIGKNKNQELSIIK